MSYAIELISSTMESCDKFAVLLNNENKSLEIREIEKVESNIKQKRHLAAKIEKLLNTIKQHARQIKEDRDALAKLPELQACIDNYQKAAKKNMVLLEAAHTTTTDFLNLIRKAIDLKKPKANTYGKSGTINNDKSQTKLINKDI